MTVVNTSSSSAIADLMNALDQVGLGTLGATVWGWWKEGRPIEQIMLDMRGTPEYKARFPAMEYLAQNERAMSEGAYIEYERAAVGIMRAAGIPEGFYDSPDDFANFLMNDVSVAELSQRVQIAADRAYNATPLERQQLLTLYGVDEGMTIAYILDPERAQPILQNQMNAVRAGAAWQNAALGQLSISEAERLALLSPDQAAESIGGLGQVRELFNPLDSGESAISRQTQIGAITGDVTASEEIQRRAERRKARFEGGGQFGQTREGLTI